MLDYASVHYLPHGLAWTEIDLALRYIDPGLVLVDYRSDASLASPKTTVEADGFLALSCPMKAVCDSEGGVADLVIVHQTWSGLHLAQGVLSVCRSFDHGDQRARNLWGDHLPYRPLCA